MLLGGVDGTPKRTLGMITPGGAAAFATFLEVQHFGPIGTYIYQFLSSSTMWRAFCPRCVACGRSRVTPAPSHMASGGCPQTPINQQDISSHRTIWIYKQSRFGRIGGPDSFPVRMACARRVVSRESQPKTVTTPNLIGMHSYMIYGICYKT